MKLSTIVRIIGVLLFVPCAGFAQTRLVLNGGLINISQGTYLVIDNPAPNAITRNSGHIISESQTGSIRWNIGTTAGTYIIPLGYAATNYMPLTFTKAAGTGSGFFLFSTYHTAWNNISQLPTGVTNVNGSAGTDNSSFVSDRFWQISAQSYTTKPDLTNLEFTYLDAENASPNTIVENNLRPKRYNSALNSWVDNILPSSLNTTTNKLTVASVDAANLQNWWMLGTLNGARYWVASTNSTSGVSSNWSEISGGPGNAIVPVSGDVVVFDGSSSFNCIINSDLTVSSLTVSPGFIGTITQGASAITVNSAATFSGGSFTGGTSNMVVNGPFTISGTSFTAPSASLDVKGDFNITSGSFNHNNGTVIFSGTSVAQNISSTAPATFNNILATNTAASPGVVVQNSQNLKGVLTLGGSVNFDADGNSNNAVFKLLSTGDNPTQDAAIAALPTGAQVSGNVTVQRFMTKEGFANTNIYRYISSPVQNGTVSDLQQEIPVSGKFTGKSVCSGCGSSASLFRYNEPAAGNKTNGYVGFPSASNSEMFQPGRGYSLLVRGSLLSSTLWDLRGVINTGNVSPVTLPVAFTWSGSPADDGWNLVGNPFPSAIDWNAATGWTKANVSGIIYVTDNGGTAIQFSAWNGVTGTNGGSRYIATGQGFWVRATGGGTPVLQANENVKAPGTQTTFFREAPPTDLLRVAMVQSGFRDETVIHFREDATNQYDSHADAVKMVNGAFNLSSKQEDGIYYTINSLAPISCTSTINLSVDYAKAGTYRLDFSEYESFEDGTKITLEDSFTGSTFDIGNGAGYTFAVTANSASYGANRFKISFSLPDLRSDFLISGGIICEASQATLTLDNGQRGVNYEARSVHGTVYTSVVGKGGRQTLSLPFDSLMAGMNDIIIRAAWDNCSSFLEKKTSIYKEKIYEVASVESGQICRVGTTTLKASGAPKGGYYNWYETDSLFPFEQHDPAFLTPELSKSKTYYVSIVNSLGCEGARTPVVVNVVQFDDATISLGESGGELISNFEAGNQWYFNGELVEGAIEPSVIPQQSGTYGLVVGIDGCSTQADYEFVVKEVVPGEDVPGEVVPGMDDPETHGISIFPNPVDRVVTINVSDTYMDIIEMRIINPKGQVVRVIQASRGMNEPYQADMASLPSGIYILRVIGKQRTVDVKLLKN